MNSVNKVTLIGNLGTNVRMSANSATPVATFKVVTNENYVDKGEKKNRAEWHFVVALGKLAELCNQYIKIGSLVYVEGKLQYRKVTSETGEVKYVTEIRADNVLFLNHLPDKDNETVESTDAAVDENGDINGNLK